MAVAGDLGRQIAYLEAGAGALRGARRRGARRAGRTRGSAAPHSLIDSIYADHLDIGRAFEHFDAARAGARAGATAQGARPPREPASPTALTYGARASRTGIEAGARAMAIGERARRRGAVGGRCASRRLARDRRRASWGRASRQLERGVRGRRPRAALAARLDGAQHPRPDDAGASARPTRPQAYFERPHATCPTSARPPTAHEIADGVGRCHLLARRARRGARACSPTPGPPG